MDNTTGIRETLERAALGVDLFTQGVEKRISRSEALTSQIISEFQQTTSYRIQQHTGILIRGVSLINSSATYHITRATFHASPEIFALIMTFVTIVRLITWVARIYSIINFVGTIWRINQVIQTFWPQYKLWWDNMMNKVSEMSAGLGWGVDGILHFVNAVNIGVNMTGRLMGKEWDLLQVEAMEKSIEMSVKISRIFEKLKDNPSAFLDDIFKIEQYKSGDNVRQWLWGVNNFIQSGLDIAQRASDDVLGIIGELSAIQENMPVVVRDNIPSGIWTALADADTWINDKILPNLATIDRNLQFMDAILKASLKRGSELADKLAHPGDVLLGVDDLPDYVKKYQEGLIDDVTSREFAYWTNQERGEMQGDFDEFDRIDRLATAPTPEPAYLSMEVPIGRTVRGITAEPQETWFVGDY